VQQERLHVKSSAEIEVAHFSTQTCQFAGLLMSYRLFEQVGAGDIIVREGQAYQ
jgi:hypothetical protein